jgi:hypothetical protein
MRALYQAAVDRTDSAGIAHALDRQSRSVTIAGRGGRARSAVRYADGDDGGVGYDRSYEGIMCACLEHSARQTPGSWPMLATYDAAADRDQRVAGGADGPIGGQL